MIIEFILSHLPQVVGSAALVYLTYSAWQRNIIRMIIAGLVCAASVVWGLW